MCHHQEDFGVDAEWLFWQFLLEKVLVMALVAQLNASLQELACKDNYDEQIMTPCQLFEWASDNIHVQLKLLFMTALFLSPKFHARMTLYRKGSVVGDYLLNVASDHQILHALSLLHLEVPEYGTTVEYTCTLLQACVSLEPPLV